MKKKLRDLEAEPHSEVDADKVIFLEKSVSY